MVSTRSNKSKVEQRRKPDSPNRPSIAFVPPNVQAAVEQSRKPGRASSKKHVIDFVEVYELDRIDRFRKAENGIPAIEVITTARSMNIPDQRVMHILKYSKATIARKVATDKRLTRDESERLLGLQMLVGQVQAMVRTLGEGTRFNAPAWVDQFLATPCAALGAVRPEVFMPSSEGRQLVSDLVSRMGADIYS